MPMLLPTFKRTLEVGIAADRALLEAEGAQDASLWSHYEFNRHTNATCHELGAPTCALFEATDALYRPLVERGLQRLHLSAVFDYVATGGQRLATGQAQQEEQAKDEL